MSSTGAILSGISGRYAAALFDLAKEAGQLERVEADFDLISGLLAKSDDFGAMTISPILKRAEQMKAVQAISEHMQFHTLTTNFLGVLAQNGRLEHLQSTLEAFARLLADERGEITGQVISAFPLTDVQLAALNAKIKASVGRDVNLEATDDPTLLGGLVVKIGSRMVDSSIRTKLENLKVSMKGV